MTRAGVAPRTHRSLSLARRARTCVGRGAAGARLKEGEGHVKKLSLALALVAGLATPSWAQTEGKVSVGGSVTLNQTTDGEVRSATTVGPLVRLNPRKGWGPAGAFNWFRADLENPAGGSNEFARLRVRPLMAGVSYTIGTGNLLTSFSIVGGPSFNKAEFEDGFVPTGLADIDAENSIAVRPGVGLTYTVAPRVAIIGYAGYLINRPDVVYRDSAGTEFRNRWKMDAVVVSVGAVYSIF